MWIVDVCVTMTGLDTVCSLAELLAKRESIHNASKSSPALTIIIRRNETRHMRTCKSCTNRQDLGS